MQLSSDRIDVDEIITDQQKNISHEKLENRRSGSITERNFIKQMSLSNRIPSQSSYSSHESLSCNTKIASRKSSKGLYTRGKKDTPAFKEVLLKWGHVERAKPIIQMLPVLLACSKFLRSFKSF